MINKYGKEIQLPKSNDTAGERLIQETLESLGVPYKMQFSFDVKGLRNKKYDAAVFESERMRPVLLIEYDGADHTDPSWYERMGVRPGRCKMHMVKRNLGDAEKDAIALSRGCGLLRIGPQHNPDMIRDLIISYVWTFLDREMDTCKEILAINMLDKYGWDFTYIPPSDPGSREADFIETRMMLE